MRSRYRLWRRRQRRPLAASRRASCLPGTATSCASGNRMDRCGLSRSSGARRTRACAGSSGRLPREPTQPRRRDAGAARQGREAVAELDQLLRRRSTADGRCRHDHRRPRATTSPAATARRSISARPRRWSTPRAARRSPALGTLTEAAPVAVRGAAARRPDRRPSRAGIRDRAAAPDPAVAQAPRALAARVEALADALESEAASA